MKPERPDTRGRSVVFAAAALASLLALLPVMAAHHLPLVDAPGHEAGLAELHRLLGATVASPFYRLDSFLVLDLGFDAALLPFAGFVAPELLGRCFFAVTLLLTLWGTLVLNRVATGRWSLAPLAVTLLLYNLVTVMGFFSYMLGIALALWALAGRLLLTDAAPFRRFVAGAAFGILLLFCHAFAFGIYAASRAALLVADLLGRRIKLPVAAAAALELLPALILFLLVSSGTAGHIAYLPVLAKLAGLFEALTAGSLFADLALAVGLLAFLGLVAAAGRGRLAPGFGLALAGLFALYLALPFALGAAANVDKRMPIVIAMVAIAALDLRLRHPAWGRGLAAVVAAAIIAKQITLTLLWSSFDPTIDAALAALQALPPGAVVMQVECHPPVRTPADAFLKWQPPMTHLVSLATLDGARFDAGNWAIPGQQPYRVQPRFEPYNRLQASLPTSICSDTDYRLAVAQMAELQAEAAASLYLFVIRPPEMRMVEGATRVAAGRDFELWVFRPPG